MTFCKIFLNTLCATLVVALSATLVPATSSAAERPAIVGGTVAAATSLPSLAQVSVMLPNGTGVSCSGTVVAPRLVLTAGHCVLDLTTGARYTPGDFLVTTGTGNLNSAAAQRSAVTQIILNPGFTPPSQSGDAALLVLATPSRAPAIQLATPAQTTDPAGPQAAGTDALMAGWGLTSATSTAGPRLLRVAPTIVQSDGTCAQVFASTFDPSSQLCALDTSDEATSACNGDSGGPLITTVDGVTVEVGVAIYVAQGCATTLPDVFTRADTLQGWVAAESAALAHPAVRRPSARRRGHSSVRLSRRHTHKATHGRSGSRRRMAITIG